MIRFILKRLSNKVALVSWEDTEWAYSDKAIGLITRRLGWKDTFKIARIGLTKVKNAITIRLYLMLNKEVSFEKRMDSNLLSKMEWMVVSSFGLNSMSFDG